MICHLAVGAFSGLQQFDGKAFVWCLANYPIAAFVVPLIWAIRARRPPTSTSTTPSTKSTYPFAADILLTLPFLIDTAGNALDLYDTIW